jgi:3-deoxy-manno-octulosonate cytidylyltransferase (CMP-KDO synthetase)
VLLFVVHPASTGTTVDSHAAFRVAVLIPTRFASTRFPGKALADLGGRPMIEHVYRRAASCADVAQVIVATDDERIAAAVRAFGGGVRLTRTDHVSGTDRIAEVAATLDCDIVVNVQGDEPLIDPRAITEALAPFADPAVQVTTLCHRLVDPAELVDPNVVKVVLDRAGFALYFSRAPVPYVRDEGGGWPPLFRHVGLYGYRRQALLVLASLPPTPLERAEALEQLRALEHGIRIRAVETEYESIGVDTPADLERVRALSGVEGRRLIDGIPIV